MSNLSKAGRPAEVINKTQKRLLKIGSYAAIGRAIDPQCSRNTVRSWGLADRIPDFRQEAIRELEMKGIPKDLE